MLTAVFLILFVALLLVAAWQDLASMLIPNWISIGLALAFVPAALAAGLNWTQIGWAMVFGAGMLLACAVLFYMSIFGGGDAKLIAAASLWTGLSGTLTFLAAMAMAGGVLAVVLTVLRAQRSLRPEAAWARRLLSKEEGAPYAVAIALGALAAIPASPVLAPGAALVLA
jgi:prepilin peptidase CpaA